MSVDVSNLDDYAGFCDNGGAVSTMTVCYRENDNQEDFFDGALGLCICFCFLPSGYGYWKRNADRNVEWHHAYAVVSNALHWGGKLKCW